MHLPQRHMGRIGRRLTGAFAIVILILVAGEAITVVEFANLHKQSSRIAREDQKQVAILRVHTDLLEFRDELDPVVAEGNTGHLAAVAKPFENTLRSDLDRARDALRGDLADSEDFDLGVMLDTVQSSFPIQIRTLLDLAAAGDWGALRLRYQNQTAALLVLTSGAVAKVDEAVLRERAAALRNIQYSEGRLVFAVPLVLSLSVLAAGLLGFAVTQSVVHPLRELNAAARALKHGDLQHRVTPARIQELATVGQAFNEAAAELQRVNDRLSRELAERVRAEQQVVALNERLINAQEEERMRIARELHDDFSQQLAALSISLSNVKHSLPDSGGDTRSQLDHLQNRLTRLAESIRHLSHELHPAILEHAGIAAALRSYCEEFHSITGVNVHCHAAGLFQELSPQAALCIYRVAQEALRNVSKHSGAKDAEIRLARSNGFVFLSVSDCGTGCAPGKLHGSQGLGLISMKERARQLNGIFEFSSEPGSGVTVKVAIPV